MPSLPAALERRAPRRWLTRRASEPLLRSAYSLVLNVALTSALGFGFWIVAARLFPAATVGRDSALIAAMLTLSTVCQLNLSSGILRLLPVVKIDVARAVLGAYAAAIAATTVAGVLFVVVAPAVAHNFKFLQRDTALAVVFVVAAALWGVFALQDAVLTALRCAPWIPLENATFGVLKIGAVVLFLTLGATHAVFVAWVVPMALLVVPVNALIFGIVIPRWPRRTTGDSPIERFGRLGLARYLAQDYLGAIFLHASSTLLPVVVVALLGTRANAHFYIPFMIVSSFDLLFLNVASSLTVEGALREEELPSLVRTTVRRFGWVLLAGIAVLVLGASVVLLPFGAGYARAGAPVLRLLACASVFRAVVALFVGIARVEGRAARILSIQAGIFALVMGLSLVLGRHGIAGVAFAWLIANAVAGCLAAPHVLRLVRRGRRVGEPAMPVPTR